MMENIETTNEAGSECESEYQSPGLNLIAEISDDLRLTQFVSPCASSYKLAVRRRIIDAIGDTITYWEPLLIDGPILNYFLEKYGNNPVE